MAHGPIPGARDVERSLLGGIIADPASRKGVFEIIPNHEFFYDHAHQQIFKAIRDIIADGHEPDLVLLAQRLHDTDQIKEIGGAEYLADLFTTAAIHNHLELARKIADMYVRRQTVRTLADIEKKILDKSQPAYATLVESSKLIASLTYPLLADQQKGEQTQVGYVPFPLDTFPKAIAEFIEETANAMPCDTGMIVMPTIIALASCLGSSRAIQLKRGWTERPIFWGCLIAEPSSMKTPAANRCLSPLWQIERHLRKENEGKQREYDCDLASWQSSDKGLKGQDRKDHVHFMPVRPPLSRLLVNDITIETLYQILADNPRGVVCVQDELRSWFKNFSRYSSGGGSGEESKWLECWSGGPGAIDRKSAEKRSTFVANRHVSMFGTCQPEVFARSMGQEQFDSGLMARFLLVYPPRKTAVFSEEGVNQAIEDGFEKLCKDIFFDQCDGRDDGTHEPCMASFSAGGIKAWKKFYDDWQKEVDTSEGEILFGLKKLEAYTARFALLLAVIDLHLQIDRKLLVKENHVKNAARIVAWFRNEQLRVYRMMKAKPDERGRESLIALILRCGGEISPRRLMRANPGKYPDVAAAEKALEHLFRDGRGKWDWKVIGESGGRPAKVFIIG